MTLSEEKSLQRKAGIAARRALPDAARGAANAALCAHLAALPAFARAKTLLVYAAFGGEVDLAALIRRVGMGKGYYDRYLPRCQNAVTIGVAFDCQRVEHAASGTLDAVLDAFATEKGVYCHGTDPTTL